MDDFDMPFSDFVSWFANSRKSRRKSRWKRKLMRYRISEYKDRKAHGDITLDITKGAAEMILRHWLDRKRTSYNRNHRKKRYFRHAYGGFIDISDFALTEGEKVL